MKSFLRNSRLVAAVLFTFVLQFTVAPMAEARVIFMTDEGTTNADTFYIDYDDSSADFIQLQFGTSNIYLQYDIVSDEFDINVNFNFNQYQAINLVLEQGTVFPSSPTPVVGQVFYRTDLGVQYIYNGTDEWVASSSSTGSGKVIEYSPEYEDFTLYADGANNSGTMYADYDSTNNRNYYEWETRKATTQDYDIVLQVYLPDDFVNWQGTGATLVYRTESGASITQIDVTMKDTAGAAVTLTGSATDLTSTGPSYNNWKTAELNITDGTFTPGEYFTILLKLHSTRSGGIVYAAQVGELIFFYNTP